MEVIRRLSPKLLAIGLGLETVVLLASYWESTGEIEAFFQATARLSGRVSLLFFAMLMVVATLHPTFERSSESFQIKFRLFRDFAILHVIHWFLLATSIWFSGFELVPARLVGGALAYVLVVGMPIALRSNLLNEKALGWLQRFYLLWVWFVFFMTYVTRLRGQNPDASGSMVAWWPLLVFTVSIMVWRVWKRGTPPFFS